MRAPASLRGRLALWLGLALVALWLATALLTAGLMRRELDALFDSALQESAERLLPLAVNDVLGRGPADENDEDDPRILGVIAPHDEFLTYVLRDPAGRVLLQSHAVDPAGFPPWDGPGFRSTATLRLYNIAALRDTVRLTVAEPLAHRARIAREALWMLLLPLLVVVPLAFAAIWLALRAGLAPLQRWRERLAARGARDLSPVSAGDLPSELAPIAATLDDVLCRLSAAFEAERSFAANAAHELRTPLAALRARLESRFSARELGDVALEIEQLARLVEQLLCLARLDSQEQFQSAPFDAHAVALEVARELAPAALEKEHYVTAATPEAAVPAHGNATLTRLVFRNLIENAIQYTPPGASITLSAGGSAVVVADDGPGIPPQQAASLFERFRRGPNATGFGAGLGLAIASRIMERQGGRLYLEANGAGGARFVAEFSAGAQVPRATGPATR